MPERPVISNNSPLVYLWHLDLLSLLRDLYTEVWIPREVEKKSRRDALDNAPWIKVIDVPDPESVLADDRLDSGEAAVLALAKEHEACLVIINEKRRDK